MKDETLLLHFLAPIGTWSNGLPLHSGSSASSTGTSESAAAHASFAGLSACRASVSVCRGGVAGGRPRKFTALVSHAAGRIAAASTVVPVIVTSHGVGARRLVDRLVACIAALALTGGTDTPMIVRSKSLTAELIGSDDIPIVDATLHVGA